MQTEAPARRDRQFLVKLTAEEKAELKIRARMAGESMSEVIRRALRQTAPGASGSGQGH